MGRAISTITNTATATTAVKAATAAKAATTAWRGAIVHWRADPRDHHAALEYFADGLLIVRDGYIERVGPAAALLPTLGPEVAVIAPERALLMPGFIDTHIHYAQTAVIASYGEQLLTWLEKYTFPAEAAFADADYAQEAAEFFLTELLKNGTTTALTFATVHPGSVDAIFKAAQKRRMRLISGKVWMDRHCPEYLRDTADSAFRDSQALFERWHGQDRLLYAVTPRFAPTSTAQQMRRAGELFHAYPGIYMQSHVAENPGEVAWAQSLFPDRRSYLDIYDHYQQLGMRSVFAHCLWLDQQDRQRMAATGAAMSFCPTSNLFLGSGLFDLAAADEAGVRVGLGSDVGGGTSFSMLRTLSEAYKVLQLKGQSLSASRAFYLATLGGARSLCLDELIGNFEEGKEADFVVLDLAATDLLSYRTARCTDIEEQLFALMLLGDDRAIRSTVIMGQPCWQRPDATL